MRHFLIAAMLILPVAALADEDDGVAAARAIESLFPDYVIMKEGELDAEMVKYLRQKKPSDRNRSLTTVAADFDGNGLKDYAAIVRKMDSSDSGFVMILQIGEGRFRAVHEVLFGGVTDYVFISPVAAGRKMRQTEAIDAPMKAIVLRYSAVRFVFFEKSALVYYWDSDAGKIDEIWTSD